MMGEAAGYLLALALLLLIGVTLNSGCGTRLSVHERMGALSRGALRRVLEGKAAASVALPCAKAAREAGEAIQSARRAQAEGREDIELTTRALALPQETELLCRAAGIKAEVR